MLQQIIPDRQYSADEFASDENSMDMEAGYDTLEEEDEIAAEIADMEDKRE